MNPLENIEVVGNVATKKTRLDWGEGLAKYEKQKRETDAPAIGINDDLRNSSTKTTEMVACPDIVPAFSCRSTHGTPAIGDLAGSRVFSGANGDLDNNSSSMIEKAVCSAASGYNPPQGFNSSTNMIETITCEGALPSSNRHTASQGDKCDSLSTSTSTTEAMVCPDDAPSFPANIPPQGENNNLDNRSMSVIEETVMCPATVLCF